MYASGSILTLALSAMLPLVGSPREELRAASGQPYDQLGLAVESVGHYVLLGSPYHDSMGDDAGAVFLFDGMHATEALCLNPTNPAPGDRFGSAISACEFGFLFHDLVACVGAPGASGLSTASGVVHCIDMETGEEVSVLMASDSLPGDEFGSSVSTCNTPFRKVLIGAPGHDELGTDAGAAYRYSIVFGNQDYKLLPDNGMAGDGFGGSVGLSGNFAIVGARGHDAAGLDAGAAYIFHRDTQREYLLPGTLSAGDSFGAAVAIDGQIAIVGAPGYDANGSNSGAVFLFRASSPAIVSDYAADEIILLPDDGAPGDGFGTSVSLRDGVAVVGTRNGAAYVFDADTGEQLDKLLPMTAGNQGFGRAVAIADGTAVVGMPLDTVNGSRSGAASLYDIAPRTTQGQVVGSLSDCPCGDPSVHSDGAGCRNSTGNGARLETSGTRSMMRDDLRFRVSDAPANTPAILCQGTFAPSTAFYDGVLCIAGEIKRLEHLVTDANGNASSSSSIVDRGEIHSPGYRTYQVWYRDSNSPNGGGANLTNGLRILWI